MSNSRPSSGNGPPRGPRNILTSRYFWLGGLGLVVGLAAFLILMDTVVMQVYTRHGATVTVPDVRQLPANEARRALRQSRLGAEIRNQSFNPTLPADQVVDQMPGPNARVKPGRSIYVYVNASPTARITVPDLLTLSEGRARSAVSALGLRIGRVLDDTVRTPYEGTVTRQSPTSGLGVPSGSEVSIWLSPGPGTRAVLVPEVEGMEWADARRSLIEAGLYVTSSGATTGTVVRQEPESGTSLTEGQEVRLFTE
ncbi:PASTA domain-containing protein [soil metagenome]